MEEVLAKIQELVAVYGLKALASLVILLGGRWVAKLLTKLLGSILEHRKVAPLVASFVTHMTYIGLMTFIIIAALGNLGIQTGSFIAVVGAAGLAIGLALQGSLSNFAAGVLIVIFRPFKVGDYIDGAGVAGVVKEIQIFNTILTSVDNKLIIVPNAKLTGDNIINYSANDIRRVDLTIGVGYGDDLDKVRTVLQEVLVADARVLDEPAPTIAVAELADSSVNFAVRPWCKTAEYWDVYFGLTEAIKKRFDADDICIPFPQRDVHLHKQE
jgi:small conductance mechanosensitive channel